MGKMCFEITSRDVLFFRDARPMDVDKDRTDDVFNIGHGANWPRPDQLFSAAIHELIRNPNAPESEWYGTVSDLRVTGPFPILDGKLFRPTPLDWDMRLFAFDGNCGLTDISEPLEYGFADRFPEKKAYPRWISCEDYVRYLDGQVGIGKGKDEGDAPADNDSKLYCIESRAATTLDSSTGASKRIASRNESGQYMAEYLRLGKKAGMICSVESEKAEELEGRSVRFGGQAGMAYFAKAQNCLQKTLESLPRGKPSRFVRWTLLSPALFAGGWYPNWLERDDSDKCTGKVMIPMEKVLRRPGETRAAYRARMKEEMKPFETARLVGACIGKAVAFSGYDSKSAEKPTELAVPPGSCYVFRCDTVDEAQKLVSALNLKPLSDLGEKGFGLGVCSYMTEPAEFTA